MPGKSSHVKNEKQYEALKDKGMSKERAAKIATRQMPPNTAARSPGQERRLLPRRHHGTEESRRTQGRQGNRSQALTRGGREQLPQRISRGRIASRGVRTDPTPAAEEYSYSVDVVVLGARPDEIRGVLKGKIDKVVAKALTRKSAGAFPKLTTLIDGKRVLKERPPLVVRIADGTELDDVRRRIRGISE